MPTLVIGSWALNKHLGHAVRRPKDLDVFSDQRFEVGKGVDAYWHEALRPWLGERGGYATLDELYTIKVSHSYWDLRNGSWEKHIEDATLLKRHGAALDLELHDLLYRVWEERHGAKRVDLTKEAADFFRDGVKRLYDHDSIHRSVAYIPGCPMYELALKPGASVQMDMDLVRSWSTREQLDLFREEIYATALERIVIPSDYTASPRRAYAWALRRTITSLTKGWSARFLVEHYDVLRTPDHDYVKHHRQNAGHLIPLEVAQ